MSVVPPLENLYSRLANGVVKITGNRVALASAGTDYLAPTGNGSGLTGLTQGQVAGLTAALATLAVNASVVHNTGAETVAGVKTFSSTIVGSVSGNAGTVTNGVVTTGTYADPSWVTSLSGSKITGNISGAAASITGSITESQVTNLTSDLAAKAPLASPALSGTPTAPTATPGTNTTQVATTAFVAAATPAASGSTTQIQFNNVGAIAGDAGFTYVVATSIVTVNGGLVINCTGSTTSQPSISFNNTSSTTPIIKWNSQGLQLGVRFYSGATEVLRIQDNGVLLASNISTFAGLAVSGVTIQRGTAQLLTLGGAGSPAFLFSVATSTAFGMFATFAINSASTGGVTIQQPASWAYSTFTVANSASQPLFTLDNLGRPITANTTPTVAAGAGAGTSPTVAITGTDVSGVLTITTGTSPTGSNATIATITFSGAYGSAPKSVQLTPAGATSAALSGATAPYVDASSISTTVWVLKSGSTALAASTTHKFFYQVEG